MTRPTCCNGDCDQGRRCPEPVRTPGAGGAVLLLVLFACLMVALAGCGARAEAMESGRYDLRLTVDQVTGCEYLTYGGSGITPRIAADGKTHIGCHRGGRP